MICDWAILILIILIILIYEVIVGPHYPWRSIPGTPVDKENHELKFAIFQPSPQSYEADPSWALIRSRGILKPAEAMHVRPQSLWAAEWSPEPIKSNFLVKARSLLDGSEQFSEICRRHSLDSFLAETQKLSLKASFRMLPDLIGGILWSDSEGFGVGPVRYPQMLKSIDPWITWALCMPWMLVAYVM